MQLQQSGAENDERAERQDADRRTFGPDDVFTLQEVLARESRDRGTRKTMQEALEEMVRDYCGKHGVKLPSATKPTGKS